MIQQTLFVLSLLYNLSLLKIKIVLKDYVGDKYRFWNIWTVNIKPLIYNARTYTVSMSISQTFSPSHHVNKKNERWFFCMKIKANNLHIFINKQGFRIWWKIVRSVFCILEFLSVQSDQSNWVHVPVSSVVHTYFECAISDVSDRSTITLCDI